MSTTEMITGLSRRERQILAMSLVPKKQREIADELGLSPRTVENHRARILKHLKAESLLEIVLRLVREKGVELNVA